jgi:hypothetical protein
LWGTGGEKKGKIVVYYAVIVVEVVGLVAAFFLQKGYKGPPSIAMTRPLEASSSQFWRPLLAGHPTPFGIKARIARVFKS